jgi:hypothetical protein
MVSAKIASARIGAALCLLMLCVTGASLAATTPQGDQDNSVFVWLDKRHPIVKLALTAMSARGYDTSPYRQVLFRKTEEHYSLTFYPSLARDAKRGPLLVVVVEIRGGKVISICEAPGLP